MVLGVRARPLRQREARAPPAVRDGDVPRAGGRLRRADGLERAAALLHREGGQGAVAAALAHLLQPPRPAALQDVRAAGGEAELRRGGDGGLLAGVAHSRIAIQLPVTSYYQMLTLQKLFT